MPVLRRADLFGCERMRILGMAIPHEHTSSHTEEKRSTYNDGYSEYHYDSSSSQNNTRSAHYEEYVYTSKYPAGVNPNWPLRSKLAAALLAFFLGGIGAHKFYMGQIGTGILFLLFCWTGIPEVIGILQGISYLVSTDANFMIRHKVRVY